MSGRGVTWAWGITGISPNQRLLAVALGHVHGHADGLCFVGTEKLATMTGLDRRTVQRNLNSLIRIGHVEVIAAGVRGRATEYRLIGLDGARKGGTVPPHNEEKGGTTPPNPEPERAAPVQERAAPVHEKGGTVPPPPGMHLVKHHTDAGARERAPPRSVSESHTSDRWGRLQQFIDEVMVYADD